MVSSFYTYEIIKEDGSSDETFETLQRVSEPPLTTHPETGQKVRRVFRPPNIGGDWGEVASKNRVSDENLDRLGFTKFQKVGKGQYERRAGKGGPKQISLD